MKCIGYPSRAQRRSRPRPIFNHLLLAAMLVLAQSFPGCAWALAPVVNMAGADESMPAGAPEEVDDPAARGAAEENSGAANQSPDDAGSAKSSAEESAHRAPRGTSPAVHFNPTDAAFVQKYLKSSDYIPVSEIKPGMEGYGLTVFQGTKPERFGVKVIGIIRKALNGRDAILIRLSGEKLGKNNVVRGMSGSPIYLNGRLCGALSYGFDFSKEPIVGVTPVVDMLDALSFLQDEKKGDPPLSLLKRPAYIEAPASSLLLPNTVPVAGGSLRMTPLLAPVSLSGFSPRAQEFLKDKLGDVGLSVSSGSTGALDPSLVPAIGAKHAAETTHEHGAGQHGDLPEHSSKVSPGSAVAVMLTSGAFSSAATGTATAVFGNKVVAFGHAFMEGGPVSLPMATAYILEILPSLSVSFKLSSPIQIVGTIFADRPWSVGAELGRMSTMVPVNVTVTDEARGVKKVFHCKVVNHPQLTPDLVTASVMSSLDATYQAQSPYVVKAETSIELKDHAPIKRVDRFPVHFTAHSTGLELLGRIRLAGDPVSGYVGSMVDRLVSNEFERAKLSSVSVDLTIENGRKVTKIDRVSLDRSVVAPGEEIKLRCLMRPYNARPYVKEIPFRVPRDVPDCDMAVAACGGDELDALRKRMGISEPNPENFGQIIKKIERKERGDSLCAVLALPQQSIAMDGQILKAPPAQWTKLFFSDRSTKTPSLVRSEESFSEVGDSIIDGCHIIGFSVKRPDKVMSRGVPYSVSANTSRVEGTIHITDQAKKALDAGRKVEPAAGAAQSAAASSSAAPAPAATESSSNKVPSMWSVPRAYPHIRGIQLWRQDSEESFRGAKLDGVVADSWGRLSPGFRELARVYPDLVEDQRIWAGAYAGGNFYYSVGNKVFAWSGAPQEVPRLVAKAGGLMVPAMAADSARSTIYFAAAPGGQVFAVSTAGGEPKAVAKVSEGTITSLAVSDAGTLYIGTAGTGKLYQLRPGTANPELVFDSGQAHVSSLWYCQRENRLYVGTAEKGCVYSISCAGRDGFSVRAEYESGEHIVTGIAKDNRGNLFVATAGTGKLMRVPASGQAEAVAASEAFYTLCYDAKDDRVYSGDGEGDVTRVEIEPLNDQVHFLPVCHTEQEAVMALGSNGQGKLFCGTANVAQLRCFEISPSGEATLTSTIHDGQRRSHWSRMRLGDVYNADSAALKKSIKVETRGGETSQPDLSWSPWVVAEPGADGFEIKTQPARYLQYRLTWRPGATGRDNRKDGGDWRNLMVSRVDVSYLPVNFAPSIGSVSVKVGDCLSGKVPVVVVGNDPDADNLSLALSLSADQGKTWTTVVSDVRSRMSEKEKKAKTREKEKENAKEKETEAKPLVGGKDIAGEKRPSNDAEKKAGKDAEKKPAKELEKKPSKEADKKALPADDKKSPPSDDRKAAPPDDKKAGTSGKSAAVNGGRKLESSGGDSRPDDEAAEKTDDDSAGDDGKDSTKESSKEPAKASGGESSKSNGKSSGKDSGKESGKDSDKSKSKEESGEAAKTTEIYSLSEKITYTLDTKKQKDGHYIMRVSLSDRPSNAGGSEIARVFRAITIDNGEPQIDSLVIKKLGSGKVALRLTAHDAVSDISDCLYKIDEGDGFALSPAEPNLSDATHAVFVCDDVQCEGQTKKLTVQVFDKAGNSAKKTVNIP